MLVIRRESSEDQYNNIKEIKGDLFDHVKDRVPVHCISSDYAMGAGIAVPMAKKYNLRPALKNIESHTGDVLYVNGVMNMITKGQVWEKPTYANMFATLKELKRQCEKNGVGRLVMPKIGCGIDGLSWEKVRAQIDEVFRDSDIDILICIL